MTGTSYYNVEKATAWRSGGSTQAESRVYNERLILSLIRLHGELSKVELTQLTGLAPQTITSIVNAAADNDLLQRREPRRGGVGQPSVPFALKPEGAGSLGLAFEPGACQLVLVDFTGRPLGRARLPLPDPEPGRLVADVLQAAAGLVGREGFPQGRIAGLGIASPVQDGDWAQAPGLSPAAARTLERIDLRAELDAQSGWPVYLLPEGMVAAAGELTFSAGSGAADFLHLHLGQRLNGGLVLGGHLVMGRSRLAGSIGALPGPGGTLDDLASLGGLLRRVGPGALERALAEPLDANLAGWAETAGKALAELVLNAIGLLDLNTVVIDGPLPPSLRSAVARVLRRTLALPFSTRPEPFSVIEGSFGADAALLGAASIPLMVRYSNDKDLLLKD